jgi:hypothetical protein
MMYADWPMRGYGLMQAIARVNRVFRDKQGGLIVDYLGLAVQLKQALATCTESNPQHRSSECQEIKSARRGGAETSMGLSRQVGQKPVRASLVVPTIERGFQAGRTLCNRQVRRDHGGSAGAARVKMPE